MDAISSNQVPAPAPIPFAAAARAYRVQPGRAALAPNRSDAVIDKVELSRARPANIDRLIAARVDVAPEFAAATPTPRNNGAPLQMYRHPADKNAAATAVDAGRRIDVTG